MPATCSARDRRACFVRLVRVNLIQTLKATTWRLHAPAVSQSAGCVRHAFKTPVGDTVMDSNRVAVGRRGPPEETFQLARIGSSWFAI